MSVNDYNLKVISQDKRNVGSIFRTFNIDGDDIIGVEEHEPFELRFENNTYNAVQIRLSIDGTDVLTGKPASTKPKGDMFLVEPRGAMRLKAWPENMSGGARFVFATTEKSVAVNTHGNTAGIWRFSGTDLRAATAAVRRAKSLQKCWHRCGRCSRTCCAASYRLDGLKATSATN